MPTLKELFEYARLANAAISWTFPDGQAGRYSTLMK